MTTSIEQQIEGSCFVRFLSRSKVAILAGLVIIVVGGSVALFTPVIPLTSTHKFPGGCQPRNKAAILGGSPWCSVV